MKFSWDGVVNTVIMVFFLLIGLILTRISIDFFNIKNEILLTFLIIIPIIFYLILSGLIQEFKAPGGFELKIRESAKSAITQSIIQKIEDPITINKEGLPELYDGNSKRNPLIPLILKITVPGTDYDYRIMKEYARLLTRFTNFKFVLFLDSNDKFIGFIPSIAFFDIMIQNETMGQSFIEIINSTDAIKLIKRFSEFSTNVVHTTTTNIDAIKIMEANNQISSIVIDENKKFVGIVTKERIIAEIITQLLD
jgi:CBS domain-containing protein